MRLIEILLVEDSPGDIRLAQETLREHNFQNNLHIVRDGEAALQFLRRESHFQSAPTPDLILLDMDLPRKDGLEVIREIQRDRVLSRIPLVVLAASSFDKELLADFGLHPDCFVIKPLMIAQYLQALCCFPHLGISIVVTAVAASSSSR